MDRLRFSPSEHSNANCEIATRESGFVKKISKCLFKNKSSKDEISDKKISTTHGIKCQKQFLAQTKRMAEIYALAKSLNNFNEKVKFLRNLRKCSSRKVWAFF